MPEFQRVFPLLCEYCHSRKYNVIFLEAFGLTGVQTGTEEKPVSAMQSKLGCSVFRMSFEDL